MSIQLKDTKFAQTLADPTAEKSNQFPKIFDMATDKPLTFIIAGTAVTDGIKKSDFNGTVSYQVYFKPDDSTSFVEIKKLINNPAFHFLNEQEWTTSTILDNSGNMNVKLKDKDGKWNCSGNLTSTPATYDKEVFTPGQRFAITTNPGFWFNPTDKKYGVYFTVKKFEKLD